MLCAKCVTVTLDDLEQRQQTACRYNGSTVVGMLDYAYPRIGGCMMGRVEEMEVDELVGAEKRSWLVSLIG